MNFYAFSALVNVALLSFLAVALIIKRQKPRAAVYFNLFNLSALFWSGSYFFWQTATNYDVALFWVKMLMIGGVLIGPTFFHFAVAFSERRKWWWLLVALSYLGAAISIYWDWTSPLFVTELKTKLGIPFFPTGGPTFYFYLAQWSVWVIIAFILLYLTWRRARPEERGFKGAILAATLVAFSAGAFNFFLWFNIPIPPVTMMVSSIYSVAVTSLLLKGKFYRVQLYYFEFFAAAAVLVSVLQFLLKRQVSPTLINWVIVGLLILASYWVVKNGLREKRYLEKITLLNQSLSESLNSVINSINLPVIIAGKRHNIIAANGEARRLFGYDASNQPTDWTDFVRGKVNRALLEAFDNYARLGQSGAAVAMEAPAARKLEMTFFPFTREEKDDAVIVMFKTG